MPKKNDELVAFVTGIGSNGEGIIKTEEYTVFVPFVLVGEKVRVRILKQKDKIAYGKAVEILVPAEERVRPQCDAFRRCGGCQLQHMKYSLQCKVKSQSVQDTLFKIGNLSLTVPLAVRSDLEYAYRNKLQLPIGMDNEGNNVIGFYASRSHRIIPIDECPIHPEWVKDVVAILHRFMDTCGIDGYNEEAKSGELRHIVVREVEGKFIITLVSTTEKITGIDFLISLFAEKFNQFTFWLNVNASDTNVVFGKKFLLLYGDGRFEGVENGVRYEAGANTFLQVNENIRRKLYDRAVKSVCDEETIAVDCYAGGGLMTAMLAQRCKKAYGIEIIPEAVECADALKAKNELGDKMENICGTVEEHLPKLMQKLQGEKVTLVVDPPRKGLERSVVQTILESGVERIAMISCNPATMARDLGLLCGTLKVEGNQLLKNAEPNGLYTVESIQPFDMFPQTSHVETLVTLSRKN